MCGIALMASESLGRGSIAGDFVALLIAFSYAAAIVTMRRYHEIRMAPAACWGAAIATVASLPLAIPLSVSAHDLPLLIFFGVGQLGLGMALFVTGVGLIPAAHSALIGMIEPVLGTIWVWLAFGERPASTALIGGTIVMVSIAGNTLVRLR
jgi:drug/metabolite transporter (DMT)-like permease